MDTNTSFVTLLQRITFMQIIHRASVNAGFCSGLCFNTLYNVGPPLDAKCNLLGYRRHRSVCYTGLFPTPLVVVTISLLQWVLTLWCLVSERSFVLFSVLSSMSVCPEFRQLTDWLNFLYVCLSSFSQIQLYLPSQQFGCLENLTVIIFLLLLLVEWD
jgi:hypothetical protein